MAISLDEVRRRILIALFSDDGLMDTLVLKGRYALALVHKVGARASSFISDLDATGARIFETLKREFGSIGYVVFDEKFAAKPSRPARDQPEWWGDYIVEFKLSDRALYEKLRDDIEALPRQAEALPSQTIGSIGPRFNTPQRKFGSD